MFEIAEVENLKTKLQKINNMGWIENKFKGYGGAGNTFENLIGITQNELEIPDFNGIEIKTKRMYSRSNISLFNCVPDGPHYHEIERLKDLYGYPDYILKNYNVLRADVSAIELRKVGLFFYFKLKVNWETKKLLLLIYDHKAEIIEDFVYWDFDTIEEKLYRKLKYLALIKVNVKRFNQKDFFKYEKIKFYKLKDFKTFMKSIENGKITVKFNIGVYRSSKKEGQIHDHGTCFNINEKDLIEIYDNIEV